MTKPSAAQLERAARLLASEGASVGGSQDAAAAAVRVHEKLDAQLTPLLGRAGVQALLARSATLAGTDQASLGGAVAESAKLGDLLRSLEPSVAREMAAALFGTLLELITTLIGERLTDQVLRSAWPAMEETALRETHK